MPKIETLRYQIKADSREFKKAMNDASRAAKKSGKNIKSSMGGIKSAALSLAGPLIGLAGVYKLGRVIKDTAELSDSLAKLSKATGISVKDLSTLKFAMEQSGIDMNVLVKSSRQLAQAMNDANEGIGLGKKAFDFLGITVTDQEGKLKDTKDILFEIADEFQKMPNGSKKAATAIQLFGRKGAEMIPFLNEGSEGIRKLQKEARDLGAEIDEKTGKAAEDFIDNLNRFQTALSGLGIQLFNKVSPALMVFIDELIDASKKGGALSTSIDLVTGSLKGLVLWGNLVKSGTKGISDFFGKNLAEIAIRYRYVTDATFSLKKANTQLKALDEKAAEDFKKRGQDTYDLLQKLRGETIKLADEKKKADEDAELEAEKKKKQMEAEAIRKKDALALFNLELQAMKRNGATEAEIFRAKAAREKHSPGFVDKYAQMLEDKGFMEKEDERRKKAEDNQKELEKEGQAIKDLLNPMREYEREKARYLEIQKAGIITEDEYTNALELLKIKYKEVGQTGKQTNEELVEFGKAAAHNIQGAFADFLFQPFNSDLKSIVSNFSDAMRRMAAEMLAAFALRKVLMAFGATDIAGFSEGGYVSGPGNGSVDTVPAILANNEWVIKAPTVRKYTREYGPGFMSAFNEGKVEFPKIGFEKLPKLGFAEGGPVSSASAAAASSEFNIINVNDPSIVGDYLNTNEGAQSFLNIIGRYPNEIRSLLSG